MDAIVVGTGFGARVHVPALQHAGFTVKALVGRDIEKTRRRAARLGIAHACASLTDALRLPGVDVVVVATPPETHAPLAHEAIEAGRHVLVEKPFTLDTGEARRLRDAAASAGVVALVGHEFRFAPERVAVTRAIGRGDIGEPRLATFVWHLPVVAALDAPAPDWWFDAARGGGWLGASVSHFVDAVRVWLGEVDSINAVLPMVSARDPATMAEDSVVLRFRTRSGCEGVIQQSAAIWGAPFQVLRIAGPDGNLVVDEGRVHLATRRGDADLPLDDPPIDVSPSDEPRHRFTHLELGPAIRQAEALARLASGGSLGDEPLPPATFNDGVGCMKILDAARRSAAAGGTTEALARATEPGRRRRQSQQEQNG